MIFKSRQVNLDPKGWVDDQGQRHRWLVGLAEGLQWSPRPEFEPTRDPHPALCVFCATRAPDLGYDRICWDNGRLTSCRYKWAPRREQFDTPVNRILVDVRYERAGEADFGLYYSRWEQSISDPAALGYWSADEVEHARKVLTRLAAF